MAGKSGMPVMGLKAEIFATESSTQAKRFSSNRRTVEDIILASIKVNRQRCGIEMQVTRAPFAD